MALRDQPYLPLFVQDFLTDEKLAFCSAAATGVYIRLMCLMHKSESYGRILLKQNYKQHDNQVKNLASQLVKQMPYDTEVIERSLTELLREKVLFFDHDFICQKRMIKDFELSEKRAKAGSKGGKKTHEFAKEFAKAKSQANPEIENEIENDKEGGLGETIPPSCPESIFENSFEIAKRLQNTTYIAECGIAAACDEATVIKQMDVFCNELKAEANIVKTEKDFRRHFKNWLKIQIAKQKQSQKPENDGKQYKIL